MSVLSGLGGVHHRLVFMRRLAALSSAIAPLLPAGRVLDVGAGSGMIGERLMSLRPDVTMTGIDVHVRPDTAIPVSGFNGRHIPFDDQSFAAVMLIDVLHHTDDFAALLAECMRVSAGPVIIKDHFYAGRVDFLLLKFLDWVGNVAHGVRLPYNYFTRAEWGRALHDRGWRENGRSEEIAGLYPWPFQSLLGRRIQFLARVEPEHSAPSAGMSAS